MLGDDLRIREIELEERARISRMFRNSEAGWLFYGQDGTAYHIFEDEAQRYEAAALRQLDRFLAYRRTIKLRMFLAAVGLAGIQIAAARVLPEAWLAQSGWLIAPLIFAVILSQAMGGVLYDLRLRRWQAALARQIAARGRGAVAAPIEAQHRRHNLFKLGGQAAALVLLVKAGLGIWQFGQAWRPDYFDLALLGLAYAGYFLGLRVDETHRRRKWLD